MQGRKIFTRRVISVSFKPHKQVLTGEIVVRTKTGTNIINVKVSCLIDGGEKEDVGFKDIFHGETLTIRWNCLLEHMELRIPRIASGIVESRTDDDLETGEKRGLQPFSIVAQNQGSRK